MMIRSGLALPMSLEFENNGYHVRWRSVKDLDSYRLDRKLRAVGWHMVFMVRTKSRFMNGRHCDWRI